MREQIGQLDCLVREGEDRQRAVVLLHGFGADAADLFPLADELDPEGVWTFYVPNAPFEVPIGPAWMGRAWFPISLRDLEVGIDFAKVRPPGLDQARETLGELVFELNAKKLVLGGFSQGAMLATEFSLMQAEDISGLIIYSGTLLDEANWSKRVSELKAKPVLQSHGNQDPVVPFSGAQRLFELLKNAGVEGQFIGFNGGHEIPRQVIQKTSAFLSQLNG